jgi:hypothetical protein
LSAYGIRASPGFQGDLGKALPLSHVMLPRSIASRTEQAYVPNSYQAQWGKS